MDARAARAATLRLLETVRIRDARALRDRYPHQLSGGMRQRVAIAIALLNRPKLIIADEPTTALDVTIQGQILYEVQKLCRETGTALIWITHDLAIVSGLADRLAVMYAGRILETAPTPDIVHAARHPYTHGLLASIPTLETRGRDLFQIVRRHRAQCGIRFLEDGDHDSSRPAQAPRQRLERLPQRALGRRVAAQCELIHGDCSIVDPSGAQHSLACDTERRRQQGMQSLRGFVIAALDAHA